MKRSIKSFASFLRSPFASPQGLLARAILIVLVFPIVHLLGLRDATSVISGTTPSGEPLTAGATMLGALYLLSFFAFVVLAPILTLGAGMLWGLQAAGAKKAKAHPDHSARAEESFREQQGV